ncbi:hypothetical protein B0J14DRAFT_87894 [Halenospora varia]|nr:hypothetical protein B0J14DRAFT_87894 [Halenospora varia]
MTLGLSYTAIAPVFWFTNPTLGGYGLSPLWISAFLGFSGIAQAIWVLAIFPPLHHRIGTKSILHICSYGFQMFYILTPMSNLLLRADMTLLFWILTPLLQLLSTGTGISLTAIQLALNDAAPTSASLGTLNALALKATSGIRTVAPILFTAVFAASVRYQLVGGYLVWVIMLLLAAGTTIAVRHLP